MNTLKRSMVALLALLPLATGMADDAEVDAAVGVLRRAGATDVTILQCTSIYPAPPELTNLRAMVAMGSRLGLPFGYSDHTLDDHVAILDGEYGQQDIAMGVPCLLSNRGLSRIVDLGLQADEQTMFDESADIVRTDIERLKAPA